MNERKPVSIHKKLEILIALLVLQISLDLGYGLLKCHKLTCVFNQHCCILQVFLEVDVKT